MKQLIFPVGALAAFLAGCGSPEDRMAPPHVPEKPPVAATPLSAGTHCYFREDESTTEGLEITLTEDGAMTGYNYGNIHQEEQAYYASFTIDLTDGVAGADNLVTFDSVTEVDGDTQTGPMAWIITEDSAAPEGFLDKPMQTADCDGLEDRIFPPL